MTSVYRVYAFVWGIGSIVLGVFLLAFQSLVAASYGLPEFSPFAANSLGTTAAGALAFAALNFVDARPERLKALTMMILHAAHLSCKCGVGQI